MVKKKEENSKKLKGLGGWMIIPVINLYVVLIISIVVALIYFLAIESALDFILMSTSLIMVAISYYAIKLMHNHSKKFPNFFIWWLWISFALSLVDSILLDDYSFLGGELFFNIIWTAYMNKSVRVTNTFTK